MSAETGSHSDLTFVTNEDGRTLLDRFNVLIRGTELFDVLVGYFYSSGFDALVEALANTKKIRILVGIANDHTVYERIQAAQLSHTQIEEHYAAALVEEMEQSADNRSVEGGVGRFIEWLQNGKLELRVCPNRTIHAKLYILTFPHNDRDRGRIITGSSNFTSAGLANNLEFNVELKGHADYAFARTTFEDLWKQGVDVSERYQNTIREQTWLNDTITPYRLYLKFLYEYFGDELEQGEANDSEYVPENFKLLEYQQQAVWNATKILGEYGGVFISDVVGLGKTFISAMLANRLDGRTLVLAPPALLNTENISSWPAVFKGFQVRQARFQSSYQLEQLLNEGTAQYKNVFIDEAHRFRTETNATYELLARICRGKRVVLVTATPYNNRPQDILNQIKLFQNIRRSNIPGIPDIEDFFKRCEEKINKFDQAKEPTMYMRATESAAREIRESVLKYLMVRRTRTEIMNYFGDDLKKQNLQFPEVHDPKALFYQLNPEESRIFDRTVELIGEKLKYARYQPMVYYRGTEEIDHREQQSQKNIGTFMKILLIKRLESSFYAFRQTVNRFIDYYERFLKTFDAGSVYVSKQHSNKIFELLDNEDNEAIRQLLEDEKARRYPATDFDNALHADLQADLTILKKIQKLWMSVERDPKLDNLILLLSNDPLLRNNKVIVFSESKETVEYLNRALSSRLPSRVLAVSGASNASDRQKVIDNFDAGAQLQQDDYRILITTEILSEGVNLHRANIVINYDIPWNPTRMMQRVGRVNRVDTPFDTIHSYIFFPTEQANDQIKLEEIAQRKIGAFISLLGNDARLLTDGETIESHKLFHRLTSRTTITGEDEYSTSELKYLQVIRAIRDGDPDLFKAIKRLPKKARSARGHGEAQNRLLTYFRKGKLHKFLLTEQENGRSALRVDLPGAIQATTQTIGFIEAAERLEATPDMQRRTMPTDYFDKLARNKQAFENATAEEQQIPMPRQQKRGTEMELLKILKTLFTSEHQPTTAQIEYINGVMERLEAGAIPKQTIKTLRGVLDAKLKNSARPPDRPPLLHILAILQQYIPRELLQKHFAESMAESDDPREVILSEYLVGEQAGEL